MQDLGCPVEVCEDEQVIAVVPEIWSGNCIMWVYIYRPSGGTMRYCSLQWDEMSDKAKALFNTGMTVTNELVSSVKFKHV